MSRLNRIESDLADLANRFSIERLKVKDVEQDAELRARYAHEEVQLLSQVYSILGSIGEKSSGEPLLERPSGEETPNNPGAAPGSSKPTPADKAEPDIRKVPNRHGK